MTTVLSTETAVTRWLIDQSVDQLLERYVAWREECLSVGPVHALTNFISSLNHKEQP
jgi:hypothetical protein